jgi:hypothetical protein
MSEPYGIAQCERRATLVANADCWHPADGYPRYANAGAGTPTMTAAVRVDNSADAVTDGRGTASIRRESNSLGADGY